MGTYFTWFENLLNIQEVIVKRFEVLRMADRVGSLKDSQLMDACQRDEVKCESALEMHRVQNKTQK